MAGGVHGSLIAASSNANAVEHKHQHEQRDVVPETVGGHGGGMRLTGIECHPLPPWSIEPHASSATGTSMKRIELAPDQVTQCVVHVVKACVLVRLALVGVALQL